MFFKLRQTDIRYYDTRVRSSGIWAWYGTKVLVIGRNMLYAGCMVRIQIRCRATVGIVVSEVRIVHVAGILLRGRFGVISTANLMTQARQQVLWARVD